MVSPFDSHSLFLKVIFLNYRKITTGLLVILVLAGLAGGGAVARALAATAYPERPTGMVTDLAGLLGDGARTRLEAMLRDLESKTTAELAVVTVPTTGGEDPKMYAVELFRRWGIGKKGKDNGALLLVTVQERAVEVEVGYGLEGTLPDGLVGEILDRNVVPRFKAGDYEGGITAGAQAIARVIARQAGVELAGLEGSSTLPAAPGRDEGWDGFPAAWPIPLLLGLAGVWLLWRWAANLLRPRCPSCGSAVLASDRLVRRATPDRNGLAVRRLRCPRCGYEEEREYEVPPPSGGGGFYGRPGGPWWWGGGWRGGGGGGFGGFGGFGGGRSGGGGAGRRW